MKKFLTAFLGICSIAYAGPIKGISDIVRFPEMELMYDSASFEVLIEKISDKEYLEEESLEVGFLDKSKMERLLEVLDYVHTPKLTRFCFGICQPDTEEVISQAIKIGKFRNAECFKYSTIGKSDLGIDKGNSNNIMAHINRITMPNLKQLHLDLNDDCDVKAALRFLRRGRIENLRDIYFSVNGYISDKLKRKLNQVKDSPLVFSKIHLIWIEP